MDTTYEYNLLNYINLNGKLNCKVVNKIIL